MPSRIKCIAILKDGSSQALKGRQSSKFIKELAKLWSSNKGVSTAQEVCSQLSSRLKANFLPENIPQLKDILSSMKELDAEFVKVANFDQSWNDASGTTLPDISAAAVFEIKFKRPISQAELSEWETSNDEQLGFCVNFYWELEEDIDDWDNFIEITAEIIFEIMEDD